MKLFRYRIKVENYATEELVKYRCQPSFARLGGEKLGEYGSLGGNKGQPEPGKFIYQLYDEMKPPDPKV